jgi:hypothetical protein
VLPKTRKVFCLEKEMVAENYGNSESKKKQRIKVIRNSTIEKQLLLNTLNVSHFLSFKQFIHG